MKRSGLFLLLLFSVFSLGAENLFRQIKWEKTFSGTERGITFAVNQKAAPVSTMTLSLFFATEDHPEHISANRRLDAYFFSSNSFVIARRGNRLGICIRRQGKWREWYETPRLETLSGSQAHHLAVLLKHHYLIDQGEQWNEVQFFLDGKPVAEHRIPGEALTVDKLEIASADSFGTPWRFAAPKYQ